MKRHFGTEMDSDSDSTPVNSVKISRLGKCEVCNHKDAKYTCPKCEVKTCSLPCLQIHKKELDCTGIRDKTKFIPLKNMTEMDFLSDYTFLEECTRYVENRKRDKIKCFTRYNKSLPPHLYALRNEAKERGTTLRFLLANFTKRSINTTHFDREKKIIFWRVEWIFTNAGNLKYVDSNCSENEKLSELLSKYLNPETCDDIPRKKDLEFYQAKGIGKLSLLLKAEGVKKSTQRYYLLDSKKTLKENLAGKIIVEFPCIYICYDDAILDFDVIGSDEDIAEETRQYNKMLKENEKVMLEKLLKQEEKEEEDSEKEDLQKQLEELLIEKKREERLIKREELEKEPTNLLFSDEKLWELFSSSSEDGNMTEEEGT